MKKAILFLMAALAVNVSTFADETSESILRHMAGTFAGYDCYEVKFTVSAEGMANMNGSYTVCGNKYNIKIQRQEQFSDGTARYEIYPNEREIVIDVADNSSHNILSNPTRAFDFAPEEFDSSYKGQTDFRRKAVETVFLVPKNDAHGNGTIMLYIDAESGMPAAIDYNYQGEKITITINRITQLERCSTRQSIRTTKSSTSDNMINTQKAY